METVVMGQGQTAEQQAEAAPMAETMAQEALADLEAARAAVAERQTLETAAMAAQEAAMAAVVEMEERAMALRLETAQVQAEIQ
jgi:hypothetical protein